MDEAASNEKGRLVRRYGGVRLRLDLSDDIKRWLPLALGLSDAMPRIYRLLGRWSDLKKHQLWGLMFRSTSLFGVKSCWLNSLKFMTP